MFMNLLEGGRGVFFHLPPKQNIKMVMGKVPLYALFTTSIYARRIWFD